MGDKLRAKRDARQAARHTAKLLIVKFTKEILIEMEMNHEDQLTNDEAYDHAERRRQDEMYNELWNRYNQYGDWDLQWTS